MTGISGASTRLERHRRQFPALGNKAYFNYGGQGPLTSASLAAIQQAYDYIQQHGPFSGKVFAWIVEEANQTRQAIASELGVPPETIALTENVTVGCNIALWGIDWQKGDRILLTDCEHPGIVATVAEIGRRFGVEVSTCPIMATLDQGNPLSVIVQHLTPRTRLVVLSHILWNTGQVLPLADIVHACRHYATNTQPIRVLVDAAQSVGSLPLNLSELGADFYAFTGHKWWCGPEGLGGLYIRPDALESLTPTFIGWRGIVTDKIGNPTGWQPNAQRYEVATSAYPLYAGLRNAIATHLQWGTPKDRYEQICQVSQYLWQGLSQLNSVRCLLSSPPRAGLVSFVLTNGKSSSQLVQSLGEQGFLVRTLRDPDCLRACVHYFTTHEEIDQLVEAIDQLSGQSLG
ncbi:MULTISPECIES: aminotransferase class V-fold PLP-dependent enzyme [unclassified Coleofasciculus]|uniref:aminotransferase class V-fold PLP-dependent enzyme n=1 Tax=unclassified Coleofasciculus TaxID=2692782 RepID=UPI0018811FA9|nr:MULTISPECIES: aminotransferase class V-fold PLP-dependent enzyme [unclassified Coleofasciculus]MBE9125255.1 aminotransferase class V-fold PLP-dependent enzyme [Coleofasciculus sp. LEGE 07081]MBE9148392.1 aminotransferase class V-fold PLP-dependent enzyme [Coleofasciculus sp. LEGE 07092]